MLNYRYLPDYVKLIITTSFNFAGLKYIIKGIKMDSHLWGYRQLIIRPAVIQDAENISRIRRQNGVREGILALTSERLSVTTDFLNSLSDEDRAFAAVEDDEILGIAVIVKTRSPMRGHSASVAIMVDSDHQGRGVGKALMQQIVDESEKNLKLHRLELLVLIDNTPAIELYRKFGFEVEATKKHAAVKNGRFVDEYLMGRISLIGTKS